MAANKAPGCPPGELRTLKLAGMMYAKAQDEADAEALADSTLPPQIFRQKQTAPCLPCWAPTRPNAGANGALPTCCAPLPWWRLLRASPFRLPLRQTPRVRLWQIF